MKLGDFFHMRRAPVHGRVVVICVCFMLFSMLVIGGYLSAVMYSKAYESTYEKTLMYTEKTVQNIDQSFSFVSNTAMAVATGGTVGYWINNTKLFDPENPSYYTNVNELKSETAHVLTYSNAWKNNYISYICILVNDEPLLYVHGKQMSQNYIYLSAKKANEIAKSRQQGFISDVSPFVDGNEIYHIRTMKRNFQSNDSLTIVIATDEGVLSNQYTNDGGESGMVTYLIDAEGNIFSSSERSMVGKQCGKELLTSIQRQENGDVIQDGEKYLYFSKSLSSNSLTLVNVVPNANIVQQTFQGLPLLFLIAGLLCLILLIIGYVVSFKSTAFIKDLVYSMNEVMKKNYDVKMPHYHNESVDRLSEHFNDMTSAMKTLINDTYKAKIMRQEMELEFIQQQVNPHFLFNILSIIQIKAKLCGDETIYQMLTSLSGLLRASLYSNNNTMTTLEEEIKYAEFYLYLQKQRYCQKLDYGIEIDRALTKSQIPRLTIEPIVENSVVHGMEGAVDQVLVSITAVKAADDMLITIEDNGNGFDTSALDLNNMEISLEGTREKVGLKNTHCRLVLLYGEGYGLQILSAPGKGTVVKIRIPLHQEGREKNEI